MKIAIKKFWCVKYYKAQPYNMEHTLCVCWPPRSKSWRLKGVWINVLEALVDQKFIEIDVLLMCMCNFNIIVCSYITLFYFARENILVCEIL